VDLRTPHRQFRLHALLLPAVLLIAIGAPATPAFQAQSNNPKADETQTSADEGEGYERLRRSISKLVAEVEALAKRVSDLEKERLFDVTRVLLVGEEQRAESLQVRLRDNVERQAAVQVRLDQVDYQLRPENIEKIFTGVGMVRPEEARDVVRRRLTSERQAIMAQLELLRQERNRFQSSLAITDVVIQRYRIRLASAGRP